MESPSAWVLPLDRSAPGLPHPNESSGEPIESPFSLPRPVVLLEERRGFDEV